jgi:predicted dehydrogenase
MHSNLAIAGLGRWGKVLVDSVQGRSETVRFAAAVVRDPARSGGDAAARGLAVHTDLGAVLRDPAIDGIVLATPHSQHAAQIEACARAGKPVFVEKPVTLTRASADRAMDAAKAAGILVAAGFNRRFLSVVRDLKELVDNGALGTVLHIETHFSGNVAGRYQAGHWRIAPGESPAGGLAGSGIHSIDTIIHLAGAITEVYAVSTRRVHSFDMDDTTMVTFKLASGAVASLLTITATAPTWRVTVFGTKGKAQADGAADRRGTETLEVSLTSGDRQARTYAPFDIERAELEAFADAITGRAPYTVTADELLNGVSAFEAVPLSAARGTSIKI